CARASHKPAPPSGAASMSAVRRCARSSWMLAAVGADMQTAQLTKTPTTPSDLLEHTPHVVLPPSSREGWRSSQVWPALILLAVGTFTVGTSQLVIAGILPLLATEFDVSVAMAGWLVTAYALAFAIVTPLVAMRTGRLPRRKVLLVCMAVFVVGN